MFLLAILSVIAIKNRNFYRYYNKSIIFKSLKISYFLSKKHFSIKNKLTTIKNNNFGIFFINIEIFYFIITNIYIFKIYSLLSILIKSRKKVII